MIAQGSTRVGHHILDTTLVHGNHIGVALHHIHAVLLGYRLLGLIDTVEVLFLVVDLTVGRVHVFLLHALRGLVELSSAERHHLSTDAQPREYHATRKAVY